LAAQITLRYNLIRHTFVDLARPIGKIFTAGRHSVLPGGNFRIIPAPVIFWRHVKSARAGIQVNVIGNPFVDLSITCRLLCSFRGPLEKE
jgi:hypothetical protein